MCAEAVTLGAIRGNRRLQYRRVERLGRRLQPLAASDMPLEVLSAQVPMAEARQLSGSVGSRLARNESFRFGQHPVFGIITFLEDSRRPSNFSPQAAREARSERSIDSKSSKVGSKVEATPCFNSSLAKKLHLFRDARS